jgi:dGTPase
MIDAMVQDLLAETRARIAAAAPGCAADVRALDGPLAGFSAAMADDNAALKAFLFEHMYRHDHVNHMTENARVVVAELFERLLAAPERLPDDWRDQVMGAANAAADAEPDGPGASEDESRRARVVADYIAGMTDRYALGEHRELCQGSG